MTPIEKVSAKLTGLMPSGDTGHQWAACCPAHPDKHQSLGVAVGRQGNVLITCYAGCEPSKIVAAIGLDLKDLFVVREPEDPGITLGRLAFYKRIPINFLKLCGVSQIGGSNAVEISYRDADGKELFARRREGKTAKSTRQPEGVKLRPYGLWKLAGFLEENKKQLLLVEGESDCWALWLHGFAALGIPGADAVKTVELHTVAGFESISIWQEPDGGGANFAAKMAARLRDQGYAGRILVYATDRDAKDPSDIQKLYGGERGSEFRAAFAELLNLAVPAPLPGDSLEAPRGRVPRSVLASGLKASPYPWGEYEFSDMGNADRLVRLHGENMLYVGAWKKWFLWDGNKWFEDQSLEVERHAKQAVQGIWHEAQIAPSDSARLTAERWWAQSQSQGRVSAMTAMARPSKPADYNDLDRDPLLFVVPNGTIDLSTGKLRSSSRADKLTKGCPTRFDPDAKCPVFERFLASLFPDVEGVAGDEAMIEFLGRLFGYCATGAVNNPAILPIFSGKGSNGKSTLVNVISAALGSDYASPAPPHFLMEKRNEQHLTEYADLLGKRCVFASETEENKKLDVAKVKMLTGGEAIKCRRMKEDLWSFFPTHKLILSTNYKPVISAMDHGTWRRLRVVPFTSHFWDPNNGESGPDHLRQDPTIEAKMLEELPGVLAWIVRGAKAMLADGLYIPETVRVATNEYREEEDTVGQFLTAKTSTQGIRVLKKDLYAAYKAWCEENESRPLSCKGFNKKLQARNIAEGPSHGKDYWKGLDLATVGIDD
jgi:putative DNA primase/helicase